MGLIAVVWMREDENPKWVKRKKAETRDKFEAEEVNPVCEV